MAERGHFDLDIQDLSLSIERAMERIERADLFLKDVSMSCEMEISEEDMWRLLDLFEDPVWPNVIEAEAEK